MKYRTWTSKSLGEKHSMQSKQSTQRLRPAPWEGNLSLAQNLYILVSRISLFTLF